MTRRPLGVVGIITPFNFPIAIPAWKIAPALVYGNTVVWKPASTVPLLAIRLAQAFTEAGLPPGVLNLLIGDSDIGEAIVGHAGIDAITFTGSTAVGRRIAASAAARGVPAQAEMGGKNAAVVLDDADLDLAVEQVMLGAFRSTGQKCTATSRLIVTAGDRRRVPGCAPHPRRDAAGGRSHRRHHADGSGDQRGRATVRDRRDRHRRHAGRHGADRRPALPGRTAGRRLLRRPHDRRTRRRTRRRLDRRTVRPGAGGAAGRRRRGRVRLGQRQRVRAFRSGVHPGPDARAAGRRPDRRRCSARQLRVRRAPTRTCRSAAPRRVGSAPKSRAAPRASSSPTPPPCTCAAGRPDHDRVRSTASSSSTSAACWPDRTRR